jgi:hypothetical protein
MAPAAGAAQDEGLEIVPSVTKLSIQSIEASAFPFFFVPLKSDLNEK